MDAIILYLLLSNTNPTYTKDIKPIFQRSCSACHNASTPERNWMNYKMAFKKKDAILDRTTKRKDMPPSYWPEKLTDTDLALIKSWVGSGAAE